MMIYQLKYFKKNRKIFERITHINDSMDIEFLMNEILIGTYEGLRVSIEDVTALAMENENDL